MMSRLFSEHPYRIFGGALAVLLLLLVLLEGWRYAVRPVAAAREQASSQTLDATAKKFVDIQQKLLDQSRQLARTLQNQLQQRQPRQLLFESLQAYPQFWGSSLYQASQPIVWNNFSLETARENIVPNQLDAYVKVKKQANVLLWIAHVGFTIQTKDGTAPYHLFTARRIRQTNALPIGDDQEINAFGDNKSDQLSAIDISIYESIPPDTTEYRVLKSLAGDSVGVVYAKANNLQDIRSEWQKSNHFWRALFALCCFFIIGALLYLWLNNIKAWKGLLLQLLIVAIGWIVLNQIHIADDWLPGLLAGMSPNRILSYQKLCNFAVDGFFFLTAAITLRRKLPILRFKLRPTSYFSAIFASIGAAIVNIGAILLSFNVCYSLAYHTTVPLLTLQIFPGVGMLLFYLGLGIYLLALTLALIAINRFLLQSCRNHFQLVAAITICSFIVGLFIAQLFISKLLLLNWAFIIAAVYFGLLFTLSIFYDRYGRYMPSALRNAAIYSFLISLAGSTIIYQAKIHHVDTDLQKAVKNYKQKQDPEAKQLTNTILAHLHDQFQTLTKDDFQNRIAFIEARFTQIIQSTIPKKSRVYSFDIQMIDRSKNVLANYSTNLNSPDWVHAFNLRQLKTVMDMQQITKNSVRPIVQQPQLADAEIYQTFYRGWVPVFGDNRYEPIAWILCSVYRERPNLNKPMRAVMASLDFQDEQSSYLIQQYQHNRLVKTIFQGLEAQYPVYNVLQPAEVRALQKDSTVFYTNAENKKSYRNLLVKQPSDGVIKNSTMLPGYQDILFSFFRLSCSLLIIGFIILFIIQGVQTGSFALSKRDEHFQYRILDSFLLATLVFLILLVFVTHFAISQQNKELVEQQLFEKLEPITKSAQGALTGTGPAGSLNISLDSLAAPLDVDASFYKGRQLTKSTTPQIYQQHLLPHILPYPVYSDLFISQKRDALTKVRLDKQALLIGYRSVLSPDGSPVGAVAIPTFVKSPKFNKQLLQTTSYLIILYLCIFGLFIIATTIISRQLTRPLHFIQQGLNKIAQGNLDTTIPATSDDEIGSLARAYNTMVSRLKALQQELASAEREEAWKEMAQQVAHEIKNPLTPMKLNIQHLERQLASGEYTVEELKERVKKITQNLIVQIQSLNNIASDFSKFSKPIDEEFTKVNINDMVESVVNLYNHDEHVHMQTQKSALIATVSGAEDELRRVIINLIKNAHEAMPGGGTITLKTYVRHDSIFIEIEDNGEGISEEDKPKIFVPNFSTKTSGTGLGLAICKKVVQAHHGSISFASIRGKGTNFVIKLPLYQP